jgi:hypothetical protein
MTVNKDEAVVTVYGGHDEGIVQLEEVDSMIRGALNG